LGGDSGGVVELASDSNLTTVVATGIEPSEDCEHAETNHITIVMAAKPQPITRFLHLAIFLSSSSDPISYFLSKIGILN
jgi:hypothetical protein